MNKIISIPSTSKSKDNVTYYDISVRLPLRSFVISKRYSDFTKLIQDLSDDIGISYQQFPYEIPSKTAFWLGSSQGVVSERQKGLAKFLNELLADKEFQNHRILHEFLQLPKGFKVTLSSHDNDTKDRDTYMYNVSGELLSLEQWKQYFWRFDSRIRETKNQLPNVKNIRERLSIRNFFVKHILPNLNKLNEVLMQLDKNNVMEEKEFCKWRDMLDNLNQDAEFIVQSLITPVLPTSDEIPNRSRRVFGSNELLDEAKERPSTSGLGDQQLLQHQTQISRDQDQEVSDLRKIIRRQKEIGILINREVEEQNQMLDNFVEEVDQTDDKLRKARRNAKRIL